LADILPEYKRKFLVIIDDTEECDRAVTFAAHRVRRTGGIVVLMSVIEPPEFHGLGVEDVLRAEALEDAEQNIDRRLRRIGEIGAIKTETVIREGRAADAIEAIIAADPGIAILVLAAATGNEGPGPLIGHFAGNNRLHILVTVVPGSMSDEEIIAVC
jgi:nucleotide-binding universal stress UspA family protein